MSKKNMVQEIYITVEPTEKQAKLLAARWFNAAMIILLLCMQHFLQVSVPESLYIIFGSAGAGIEVGQLISLIKRK